MERLLEREAALTELARCYGDTGRGHGRVLLLEGEAGVGKTALIARFLAGSARRARVLRGWCDAMATPRPLGPLIDMLANLPREEAARLRSSIAAGDAEAIYSGLMKLFGNCGAHPWVWVIEDAHWADGATLDLLRFVARRIESLSLLLVVAHRDEIGDQHPLAVLLGDAATWPGVTRIALEPLTSDAVAQLAAGSGVNAEQLYRLTSGNPFFVTEVLAAGPEALLTGALPRTVSEAVWGRLARLSSLGRDTAHAVAICGPMASPELVEAVCHGGAAALAECRDAGVLVAVRDSVCFRHELARRATVDLIPAHQRRMLHQRALATLTKPPIDPNRLTALAFHAGQAGDTDALIHYGAAAAERASAFGANREAAELYRMLLGHADSVSDREKASWLERHAFSSYMCGAADAAVASWREAIGLRHHLGDRHAEGEDLRWLSHVLAPLGRQPEALEAARASMRLLESLGPSRELAWSLINMAHFAAISLEPACREYASRAALLGVRFAEPAIVLRARGYAAMMSLFDGDGGWDEFETVWRETMNTSLVEHAGVLGVLICWTAVLRRESDRATKYLAEMSTYCGERDLGMFLALAAGAAALTALHCDDWAQAARVAEDILTRPELSPQHRIGSLIALASVRARQGVAHVEPLLDEALDSTAHSPLSLQVRGARAEAAWLSGDDKAARAEIQAVLAEAGADANRWLTGPLLRWARLVDASLEPAFGGETTPYDLEISGQWAAAAEEWTRRGSAYDAAVAQLGGDIVAVQAALDTFHQLGARGAARRARQRWAQLRGRNPDFRRANTSADPHGLTRRERDVIALLAAGHSDAEIAAALHISPKTANTHVCSIMTKLGVHTRKAAVHAYQKPPTPA